MRRICITLLCMMLASVLSASDNSGRLVSNATASADVVFEYMQDYARIGFSRTEVKADDYAAKPEAGEVVLTADLTTRTASSDNIWCFWQLNNSGSYNVRISSSGLVINNRNNTVDWRIEGSSSEEVIISKNSQSAVILEKNSAESISGSKRIRIVIPHYDYLPEGRYVMPIVLTLESIS